MYDSVRHWIDNDCISDRGYLDRVPSILSNLKESVKDGYYSAIGNYRNIFFNVNPSGILFDGSVNKFYHSDNFQKMTRQQVEFMYLELSEIFSIDFTQSKITQLDISQNLIMDNTPESYYPIFGESSRYTRIPMQNSVYWRNKQREKLFYNKVLEGKFKGLIIPPHWIDKNVLRYEFRMKSRIAKQMNMSQILALDLYSEDFYIAIIDKMIEEYLSIKRNKLMTPNIENLTCSSAEKYLLSFFIDKFGQNETNEVIESWKNSFTNDRESRRFKNNISNLKGLTEISPLTEELDKKIMRLKEYYR